MSDGIRERLDADLQKVDPLLSLDVDTAVSLGRMARRRRRMWLGGGGVLSMVTAIAVAVVVLSPPSSDQDVPGDPSPSVTEDGVPELDSGKDYGWSATVDAEINDHTQAYTDAFWEHISQRYSDASLVSMRGVSEYKKELESPPEVAPFVAEGNVLTEDGPGSAKAFERTVATLEYNDKTALELAFGDDLDVVDAVDVKILPPGTYSKDTKDVFDPAWCDTELSGPELSACEVEAADGPGGTDVRHIGMEVTPGDTPLLAGRSVVLYRGDGSAVFVSDIVPRRNADDPAPVLSFAELVDIAAALPQRPVT